MRGRDSYLSGPMTMQRHNGWFGQNILTPFGEVPAQLYNVVQKATAIFSQIAAEIRAPLDRRLWRQSDYERERSQLQKWIRRLVKQVDDLEQVVRSTAPVPPQSIAPGSYPVVTPSPSTMPPSPEATYWPAEYGWQHYEPVPGRVRVSAHGTRVAGVELGGGLYLVGEMDQGYAGSSPRALGEALQDSARAALAGESFGGETGWWTDRIGGCGCAVDPRKVRRG